MPTQSDIDVIGFGAMNLDEIFVVDRVSSDDEVSASTYYRSPGGSAANTIHALAMLGASVGCLGAVGADDSGSALLSALEADGADTSGVVRKEGVETGRAVILSSAGERFITVWPGANDKIAVDDIDFSFVERGRFLHLSSFVSDEQLTVQRQIVARLPSHTRLSFAPGSLYARRGVIALQDILRRTETLFVNRHELDLLAPGPPYRSVDTLFRHGVRRVVVTLGKGAQSQSDDQGTQLRFVVDEDASSFVNDDDLRYVAVIYEPAVRIEVERRYRAAPEGPIDTVGAGDAFAAGFLWSLIQSDSIQSAGQAAQVLAELSVGRRGGRRFAPEPAMFRKIVQSLE